MRLPADDKERDARTRDALQYVLDTQRAQYQRELAWEKDHPRPPTGPPEKLHAFVDDPVIQGSAARSEARGKIRTRARKFRDLLDARAALERAEKAAWESRNDHGLPGGVVIHRDR